MTTYNLPDYSLGSYDLMLTQVLSRSVSAFTKHVQVLQHQGQLFTSAVDLGPMRRERAAKWSSFFSKLRIGVHSFTFVPFYERIPQSDVLTEVPYTISNYSYDTFTANSDSISITHDTATSGLATGGVEISSVTEGETYVVSFFVEAVSGAAEEAITAEDLSLRYKSAGHNATTLFYHHALQVGWNRVYLPIMSTGTAYMTLLTETPARKFSIKLSHIKAHKVTVHEDFENRLNMQSAVNAGSPYAFDAVSADATLRYTGGTEATIEVTSTGSGERRVAFPLRNLVSLSQAANGNPIYKADFTLTRTSGTAPSYMKAAFRTFTTSSIGSASTSLLIQDIVEGSNTIFLRAGSYLDEYFIVAMDDDTAYEYEIEDLQITKMSLNPEIDPRTTMTLSTCTNAASANDFGTFSGATTSGVTVGHDATGADDKWCYWPVTLDETKKYLITYDYTKNSGADSAWVPQLRFTSSGVSDSNPSCTQYSSQTGQAVIMQPDADDDGIGFRVFSGTDINFTISNLKVVELPDYGTDTLAARSTLQLVGPSNQTSYMEAGDFIQLPNSQMIQLEESLNTDDQGYVFTTPFPLTRSALTAGHECEIICPEIRMMIDGNTLTTGIRQPGGIYTGMSFTATELIDQE